MTERGASHESRVVLRRPGHAAARAFGHDPEAAGERRLPPDPVAPDALLRAFRPQGFHPVPRLSRRPDPRVLPELQRGDVRTTSRCPKGGTQDRAASAATSTTGTSRSSTPACTPTSASACCACASTCATTRCSSRTTPTASSDMPLDSVIDEFSSRSAIASFVACARAELPRRARASRTARSRASGQIDDDESLDQRRLLLLRRRSSTHPRRRGAGRAAVPAADRQASCVTYRYDGFWQSMDTFKDKIIFDRMEAQRQLPVDGLEQSMKPMLAGSILAAAGAAAAFPVHRRALRRHRDRLRRHAAGAAAA